MLYHVTANADWSNLPLSGLFVEMLRRVLDLAPAAGGGAAAGASQQDAQAFAPFRSLSGLGELETPLPDIQPIPAAAIDKAKASPATPAGLYRRGQQERAINLSRAGDALKPIAGLASSVAVRDLSPTPAMPLAPYAFAAAMALFILDCLAALILGGGLNRMRARRAITTGVVAVAILSGLGAHRADAQTADEFALRNALETRLAYVVTGDDAVDQVSEQGLKGLNQILRDRTSVDAGDPAAINIERDEIVFFPLLYWPVRPAAAVPSDAALAKIDAYMKNGGTIFFDLQDDGASASSLADGTSAAGDALRRMLAKLDIPPLEPVPEKPCADPQLLPARPVPRTLCGRPPLGRAHRHGRCRHQHQRWGERHHHRLQRLCGGLGAG